MLIMPKETPARAEKEGAETITNASVFYNGLKLTILKDKWDNIWWLYEKMNQGSVIENNTNKDGHNKKPSDIYTALMHAMKNLK
jgi:PhnB protein